MASCPRRQKSLFHSHGNFKFHETQCVFCEARTEVLNIIYTRSRYADKYQPRKQSLFDNFNHECGEMTKSVSSSYFPLLFFLEELLCNYVKYLLVVIAVITFLYIAIIISFFSYASWEILHIAKLLHTRHFA